MPYFRLGVGTKVGFVEAPNAAAAAFCYADAMQANIHTVIVYDEDGKRFRGQQWWVGRISRSADDVQLAQDQAAQESRLIEDEADIITLIRKGKLPSKGEAS